MVATLYTEPMLRDALSDLREREWEVGLSDIEADLRMELELDLMDQADEFAAWCELVDATEGER